jgi:hypothetical protein
LEDLLALAPEVEPPASRAEALFLILQAIFALGRGARSKVLDVLLTTCRPEDSWRVARIFQDIAWMISATDKEAAESIVAVMPDGRWKRQAQRRIEGGESPEPRQFFWSAA